MSVSAYRSPELVSSPSPPAVYTLGPEVEASLAGFCSPPALMRLLVLNPLGVACLCRGVYGVSDFGSIAAPTASRNLPDAVHTRSSLPWLPVAALLLTPDQQVPKATGRWRFRTFRSGRDFPTPETNAPRVERSAQGPPGARGAPVHATRTDPFSRRMNQGSVLTHGGTSECLQIRNGWATPLLMRGGLCCLNPTPIPRATGPCRG